MIWLVYQYLQVEVYCDWEITFFLNPNRSGFYIGGRFYPNGKLIGSSPSRGVSKKIKPLYFFSVTVFCLNNIIRISTAHSFGLIFYFASMSKLKSKDLPTSLTLLGILIIAFSDKIEELTSIPFLIITAIAFILLLIPLYIWISDWLKSRK